MIGGTAQADLAVLVCYLLNNLNLILSILIKKFKYEQHILYFIRITLLEIV